MAWGWRIPFLLALPLAFFGLWIRSQTEECEAFKQVLAQARAPRNTARSGKPSAKTRSGCCRSSS